jgi:hypothetical protein
MFIKKFSEGFIERQLRKYPTNIFELRDMDGYDIFQLWEYSNDFVKRHRMRYPNDPDRTTPWKKIRRQGILPPRRKNKTPGKKYEFF